MEQNTVLNESSHYVDSELSKENLISQESKEVQGTPFLIVRQRVDNDYRYFIALGKYRVSDYHDSELEVEMIIERKDWSLLVNTIIAFQQIKEVSND